MGTSCSKRHCIYITFWIRYYVVYLHYKYGHQFVKLRHLKRNIIINRYKVLLEFTFENRLFFRSRDRCVIGTSTNIFIEYYKSKSLVWIQFEYYQQLLFKFWLSSLCSIARSSIRKKKNNYMFIISKKKEPTEEI